MNPLEQHNDLPLAVRKRLDYFPQLLARLVGSPIWDTYEILDEALTHYKAGEDDLSQGQKFIARLKHYLEPTPMDAERREQIENWAFSTQRKEEQILNDFEMPEWKAVVTEADRATLERRLEVFTTTGRRIVERDKDLDSYGTDAANMERQIAQIEKRLAELNILVVLVGAPTTSPKQQQNSLLEMLCGGCQPEQLLKVIGSNGLGLYDATKKQPNDTATPTNWAKLYWGLQYKGFLPEGISNETACELLKNTFGAKTSKTRIGDTKPSLGEKPMPGTYWARVVDLLSRFAG